MYLYNYHKRKSSAVQIGNLLLGGKSSVRVQSMANTDTNDVENSVAQAIRMIEAGTELVRFTTQGLREAESLRKIRDILLEKGYSVPLVADVHFTPDVADFAAQFVEKVRINPGNYVRSIKKTKEGDYTNKEFLEEQNILKQRFTKFLEICKKHHTAVRIGVNHGSLSERMMNRYGDTPLGMVESALELLEICHNENFTDVVISLKASNTVLMVNAVRLLADRMAAKNYHFPLHLGVTEAGDGEDGRIKSAVGIGTLLADGIGDTIRVSLSEAPEAEIPVAQQLVRIVAERENYEKFAEENSPLARIYNSCPQQKHTDKYAYHKRKTAAVGIIGGENAPVVVAAKAGNFEIQPDFLLSQLFSENKIANFVETDLESLLAQTSNPCLQESTVLIFNAKHENFIGECRVFFHKLLEENIKTPVIIRKKYFETKKEDFQLRAAMDLGAILIDGFGDGFIVENEHLTTEEINATIFGILQAARVRTSKTEYISCPSCGRTLFDLQTVVAKIKAATGHLKGLKIGIMGCIVNGPGEMADADYGYVGAGRGKVSLYKGQTCVQRNIPEDKAIDFLINIIKENGDWREKE
jgi:(E)-4-hydroxy-3-methylbut-2-enyl-diphosphate synthase